MEMKEWIKEQQRRYLDEPRLKELTEVMKQTRVLVRKKEYRKLYPKHCFIKIDSPVKINCRNLKKCNKLFHFVLFLWLLLSLCKDTAKVRDATKL